MPEKDGRNSFYHWVLHVETEKEAVPADGEVSKVSTSQTDVEIKWGKMKGSQAFQNHLM